MNIGDAAEDAGNLLRHIRELEDQLREAVAGRRLEDAEVGDRGITFRGEGGISLTGGGGLSVDSGGFIAMRTADGEHYAVFIGTDAVGHRFFLLNREDGSKILSTGKNSSGRDFWALFDHAEHFAVSDDVETGWGLANPRLAPTLYPHHTTLPGSIGTTTSPTYVPLWEGEYRVANPWIQIGAVVAWNTAETFGEMRVRVNGVTAYESGVVTNQVINTGRLDATAGKTLSPGEQAHVFVDARVSSGSGELVCTPIGMYAR